MSIIRTIRRQFHKPTHRVTRAEGGFQLYRRSFRFFYRPCGFFRTLDEVYDFVHEETQSDSICIELYPPGDFSTHIRAEFEDNIRDAIRSSGCVNREEENLRAIPPLGPTGPTGAVSYPSPTGPRYWTQSEKPAQENNLLNPTNVLLAAVLLDNDSPRRTEETPAPAPVLDTNVPLERDDASSAAHDSQSSAAYDSHHDSSPSYDSGSSSYDSGSSSCDSGSSSCDSGSCGGGDC